MKEWRWKNLANFFYCYYNRGLLQAKMPPVVHLLEVELRQILEKANRFFEKRVRYKRGGKR